MRRSPPCAAPAGDVRRKHSSRRHGRAPGPHAQPQLTGSLCLRRLAQERHGLGAGEPRPGPSISRAAVHHPSRCMPEPPFGTAQKFLVDRLSPLTASGTVGKSEAVRRGGGAGCSSSSRCTWFSRSPRRRRSWIDYSRLTGARSARTRTRHASPHSVRPHSHCHARASASLCRSARALLTALAQGRKAPRTCTSTLQPRAPPADLASDVAGGPSEVGLEPSYGGRPMVGCLGGLCDVCELPP